MRECEREDNENLRYLWISGSFISQLCTVIHEQDFSRDAIPAEPWPVHTERMRVSHVDAKEDEKRTKDAYKSAHFRLCIFLLDIHQTKHLTRSSTHRSTYPSKRAEIASVASPFNRYSCFPVLQSHTGELRVKHTTYTLEKTERARHSIV